MHGAPSSSSDTEMASDLDVDEEEDMGFRRVCIFLIRYF